MSLAARVMRRLRLKIDDRDGRRTDDQRKQQAEVKAERNPPARSAKHVRASVALSGSHVRLAVTEKQFLSEVETLVHGSPHVIAVAIYRAPDTET